MQFTFKRDEEGRERIYVGDVCIAALSMYVKGRVDVIPATVAGLQEDHVHDAIEHADEAGFWAMHDASSFSDMVAHLEAGHDAWINDEVAVDVPVAETSTTLVVVREGDE